jgi:tryptophan-rich sensory protein
MLFLFYFCNYFVVVFFNAGIVACATARMSGGSPTVGDGFRAAASRLPLIIGWALVSATVGLILRIIEGRSEKVGRFVAALFGMAWTAVSFLVVPVLVVENKNPIAALKESTVLLKKTWGEQLISNFSFGMIFFLLSIPAVGLVVLGALAHNVMILAACIALAVIYFIVLALIQSALQSIFQAALFLYARNGQIPEGFHSDVLSNAMVAR